MCTILLLIPFFYALLRLCFPRKAERVYSYPRFVIYIRHGSRLLAEDPRMWCLSARCEENPLDDPLTELGADETSRTINNISVEYLRRVSHIYSSPYSRTMKTASIISDAIYGLLNKRLPVRADYGLRESARLYFRPTISLRGKELQMNHPVHLARMAEIDARLNPDNLHKVYNTDPEYRSSVPFEDAIYQSPEVAIPEFTDTLDYILECSENPIIVGHGGDTFLHCYHYLTQTYSEDQSAFVSINSGGAETFNFVAVFMQLSAGANWKLGVGPKRII